MQNAFVARGLSVGRDDQQAVALLAYAESELLYVPNGKKQPSENKA